ncbi:conserved hypothetical protein [Aspergillus udagawae]|uniref:Uncharacterized protein n=1 Tax=Aspergillus udagawae TaxID=91492 RepID=A0A8E0QT40_9EURO|nr:uncharacterized protein Aud_004946 [Aspergillus udagawae]GFF57651.1 conserved hypothetical protein [Aspergillus udagawae]GIC88551.1 hypothetical protein Aud_004946 [Aspergillus udagawae]
MSTVVAPATAAPLPSPHMNRDPSPKNCPTLAPTTTSSHSSLTPPRASGVSQDGSAAKGSSPGQKHTSPSSQNGSIPPKVIVKKEPPSSPAMQTQTHTRPRPRKLDLSTSLPTAGGLSARAAGGPMTARDGVTMLDVGIACLSPGFQTHDPIMREQLQRSLSVRDQQRSIIESRLHKSAKDDGPDGVRPSESNTFGAPKTGASKRRPPPGLSIVPPSAAQFSNERVIQSAPLHQTFTGRYQAQPLTRHVVNQSPTLGSTSHIHHVPATQTNNRLPPLSDVFGSEALGSRDRDPNRGTYYQAVSGANSSQSNNLPPLPSPRMPGSAAQAQGRPREYRSAEEAVHELAGGREELLPRIVHYGGHQPPTPPSPHVTNGQTKSRTSTDAAPSVPHPPVQPVLQSTEGTARRRPRSEYEQDNGSPPLGHGPEPHYRPNPALASGANTTYGPFGAGRDSPETQRRKKEEFLSLCARAWDLFHS